MICKNCSRATHVAIIQNGNAGRFELLLRVLLGIIFAVHLERSMSLYQIIHDLLKKRAEYEGKCLVGVEVILLA